MPVPQEKRGGGRDAIAQAARRYSPRLLGAVGRGVYVAADLTVEGVVIGGMSRADARLIFVAVGDNNRFDAPWIARGFHHEIAHNLHESHESDFQKDR